MLNRKALVTTAGLILLAGCGGNPSDRIAEASPATGDKLVEYSYGIADIVNLGDNADLVQRFCKNAFDAKCPADITSKLDELGFRSGGTGVDLAHTFTLWKADELDGSGDLSATDEVYLRAAYKVALGREPDEGGAQSNLAFIKQGGGRKQMLRSMLESVEFKGLQ